MKADLRQTGRNYSYRGEPQLWAISWEYEREAYERRIKELKAQLETAKQAYADLKKIITNEKDCGCCSCHEGFLADLREALK